VRAGAAPRRAEGEQLYLSVYGVVIAACNIFACLLGAHVLFLRLRYSPDLYGGQEERAAAIAGN
jgi:hypothetical protein